MSTETTHDGIDVDVIRAAWCRASSASPEKWSRANKSRGQCAITACVVQDCIGGALVRTVATLPDGSTESHYATMDEHGVILDLTAGQFPEGTEFGPWEERDRDYVLGYPETMKRYTLLCRRLNEVRTIQHVQASGIPLC